MLISAQKFRLYTKNAVLKKTVPKFLERVRQHLLLKPRNGSKYKNCSEKITEWSSRDAKCSFDNNAEKTSQEVLKFPALNPERIENINFFWQKNDSLQIDHLYKWNAVLTNVPEVFEEFRKLDARITKKIIKPFVLFESLFSLKVTLCTRRRQFWQRCRNSFSAESAFYYAKSAKLIKE